MPQEGEFKPIAPIHETLNILGDLSYSEGHRAWNLVRFKSDLLKEFPQLKERREKFKYKMIMHRNFDSLKKEITEIEKLKLPIPLLLMFGRKKVKE